MRQQVLDSAVLRSGAAPRHLTAFASLYSELERHVGWPRKTDAAALKIAAHFQQHAELFCGGSMAFHSTGDVLWSGNKEVARVLNKKMLVEFYGASLKPFFVQTLKLKSIGAAGCWDALRELSHKDGVEYTNKAGCTRLRAEVKKIYAELEKWCKRRRGGAAGDDDSASDQDEDDGSGAAAAASTTNWHGSPPEVYLLCHDTRLKCLRVVAGTTASPIFVNDEPYTHDICRDKPVKEENKDQFIDPECARER